MATDPTLPATVVETHRWRVWLARSAMLALLLLVVLILSHPALRSLAATTWREMRTISPGYLIVIFACKIMQSVFSALTWHNLLRAAWPQTRLPYRFVLGADQGQTALNTITPARAGTWAMLGGFHLAIPGARFPKLLAVWAVQSLAFGFFAACTYVVVAFSLPDRNEGRGFGDRVISLAQDRPILVGLTAAIVLAGLVVFGIRARARLAEVRQQIGEGVAILRRPERYLRLVFVPALISYAFNCAGYLALLAAFHIPVSIWTLALALGSNALAGAVRITPGGLGTSQAIDVIALRQYAPADVVTAYSLAELAITAIVSITIAVTALLSIHGLRGIRILITTVRTGGIAAGMRMLGKQQRAMTTRARRRNTHISKEGK